MFCKLICLCGLVSLIEGVCPGRHDDHQLVRDMLKYVVPAWAEVQRAEVQRLQSDIADRRTPLLRCMAAVANLVVRANDFDPSVSDVPGTYVKRGQQYVHDWRTPVL